MAKYANPPQAPPLFTGTKESIVADSKALCDTTRSLLDSLVANIKPAENPSAATFESVIRPQTEDENESSLSARILGFYQYVSGDNALRDASTEAEKIMDEFAIECSMREDVFRLVDAVYNNSGLAASIEKDKNRLIDASLAKSAGLQDVESGRLLEKERKSYIRNGLGLPEGEKRDRFKEIKKRLSQIQIAFQKNLNEENNGIWFAKEELDGVPEDVLDTLEKGTGENEGKIRLSFKYPDLFPTLKFAKSPETRKRVFIENENKVCSIPRDSEIVGLTPYPSATRTPPYSGRQFFFAMRLPDFSVTLTTPRSALKTRWPRRQRPCWTSWETSRLAWDLAVSRRSTIFKS
jgi:metallopeptidase MepB